MLFNSAEFLFVFLPFVFFVYFGLCRLHSVWAVVVWLIAASLAFHAYWKVSYTWLFVASICVNFAFGRALHHALANKRDEQRLVLIFLGIAFNLCLLGYFKYAAFFRDVLWRASGYYIDVGEIVLPLAISFYTFQQIAYLVDTYRRNAPRYSFLEYASYLAFFPHLIAGPIVRHSSLVPQLNGPRIWKPGTTAVLVGLAIIMIGLFKKVVIADGSAQYVDPIFFASEQSTPIGFFDAWLAAVLFGFVIYFDFSGYSDIAIGLARLFNVRFPENFASPYKARNIADFWRRWHITLSRFLRDYLYFPLGGNRSGRVGSSANVMITMLLGGLWHGAGWNFIIWGGLHGLYLVAFRVWVARSRPRLFVLPPALGTFCSRAVTFLAVAVAWVFFRATSLDSATNLLSGMIGLHGWSSASQSSGDSTGHELFAGFALAALLVAMTNVLPSTQDYLIRYRPTLRIYPRRLSALARRLAFHVEPMHVAFVTALGILAMTRLERVQPFIYFQF